AWGAQPDCSGGGVAGQTTWGVGGLHGRGECEFKSETGVAGSEKRMDRCAVRGRGVTHFRQPGWAGGGLGQGGQLLLVLAALGAAGYYWSCLETIPYTGRRHAIMLVSRSSERAMGRAVYDQQCQEAAAQHALLPAHHPYSQV
ncbi:hypothetical protein QJQ45_025089, partial [Haematococcus lacustris]